MKWQASGSSIWAIAFGGAALGLALLVLLFRPPTMHDSAGTRSGASGTHRPAPVELKHTGERAATSVFRDETTLRDPTPLFLPTQWNASNETFPPELQREPGSSFRRYPAQLSFPEVDLSLNLPAPVTVPADPVATFATENSDRPYLGFGEVDRPLPLLPARAGFLRVVSAGDGQLMMSQPLADAKPPMDANWQPLEFLVAIDPAGVVRPPVLTESSRVAAVDGYFRSYLVHAMHIGETLPPGFYRVYIGP